MNGKDEAGKGKGPIEEMLAAIHAVHKAFGAPGDYGYGTKEGDALAALYRSTLPWKVENLRLYAGAPKLLVALKALCPPNAIPAHVVQICGPDCAALYQHAREAIAAAEPEGKPECLCLDDPCDEPSVNDALEECDVCGAIYHFETGCPREHLHGQDDV